MLRSASEIRASGWRAAAASTWLLAAALSTPVAAASGAPASVPVQTSRGEFKLLVSGPDPADAPGSQDRPLVLLTSGEGGWRHIDTLLAGYLTSAGCWVGGIDVTKYFWDAQDDRKLLAADTRAFAAALAKAAGRKEGSALVLAGFSFGADLAPWMAGGGGWESRVRGLIMIAPDEIGSLQFRLLEILGMQPKEHIFSVAEALASAGGVPAAFIHGEKDDGSAAPSLTASTREPKKLLVVPDADHHFSGKEAQLRSALLEALDWISSQKPDQPHE